MTMMPIKNHATTATSMRLMGIWLILLICTNNLDQAAARVFSSTPSVAPSMHSSAAPTSEPSRSFTPSGEPSDNPTAAPTEQTMFPSFLPSQVPSDVPSDFPSTMDPTFSPSNAPSDVPSDFPSQTHSSEPTSVPTIQPSGSPSSNPSLKPSWVPSSEPTSAAPTKSPTTSPSTAAPSASPTELPSNLPSSTPSDKPSPSPTLLPTRFPSVSPTQSPSLSPSFFPTITASAVPSTSPTDTPTTKPTTSPSATPSDQPSMLPTTGPTTSPSLAPSMNPTLLPTSNPSTSPSASPSSIPSDFPSLVPSLGPSSPPTRAPSNKPSNEPSTHPSARPSPSPSSIPSTFPTDMPSNFPSAMPSLLPTSSPSTLPSSPPTQLPTTRPSSAPTSSPSSIPSNAPSVTPTSSPSSLPSQSPTSSPTSVPSQSPTRVPSIKPTDDPTLTPSNSPSNIPTDSPSISPSRLPSVSPSSVPTQIPTVSPSSLPSKSPSEAPTPMPSVHPTVSPTRIPSESPTPLPSTSPSTSPTEMGEIFVIDSVTLESTSSETMDAATTEVFEEVCGKDFLSMYIHQLFASDYDNLQCHVIEQTTLDGDNDGARRRLSTSSGDAVVQIATADVAIILRVTGTHDLPEGVPFEEVVSRTFKRFLPSFQSLLADETSYFKDPVINVPNGITEDPLTAESTADPTTMIIIGSVLVGASIAVGVSVYYLRRSRSKEPATPPQDVTDDSILLLFDVDENKKENRDDQELSINPYLPPTPVGIGVPSEIGPHSWIEPDDDLSEASPDKPDNEGLEANEYKGEVDAFGFRVTPSNQLQTIQQDPQAPSETAISWVPGSRAAQILASLASESFSRLTSESHVPVSRTYPLETVESRESEDDDTKPTVSSKGSQPTRSSANTQSDGSSTLHGLKLIGTMSGFPSAEPSAGSAPPGSDKKSDPPQEKKHFFRNVMKRKSSPSTSTLKSPPTKTNLNYESSNNANRGNLVLPAGASSAAREAARDDNSSLPTSASAPTQVMGNKSTPRFPDDSPSIPSNLTSDSLLFLSQTASSAAQSQLVTLIPTLPSPVEGVPTNVGSPRAGRAPLSPSKKSFRHSGNDMLIKRQRSSGSFSNFYSSKSSSKRPIQQEPPIRATTSYLDSSSTMALGPGPFSPVSASCSQSVESVSVDPRRAAGTPTESGTMRPYEECTIRSPLGSFVRKNETPSGTRFLQMNTDSAKHTGRVLEDLGRMEDEWDGQLESKLSATASTPRHTNSEKFRRPPRQRIFHGEL